MTPRARHLRNKTIAIIGVGQIGGSMLKRLSPLRPAIFLLAHDRDRRLALKTTRYASWVTDLSAVVTSADIIILAIPVPAIIQMIREVARLVGSHSKRPLVFDTGTVKSEVEKQAAKLKGQIDYVGLHPLAGNEGEGWGFARADLFVGRQIVCTLGPPKAVAIAHELIALLGASPLPMDAKTHDRLVAEAIGLPHFLAFAAQRMVSDNPLCAGSWASLTRVAASSPEMVAGFLSANAVEQKRAIARLERQLARLKKTLDDRSGKALYRLLAARRTSSD